MIIATTVGDLTDFLCADGELLMIYEQEVFTEKDANSSILGSIQKGESLELLNVGFTADWLHVVFLEETGFIPTESVGCYIAVED